MTASQRNDEGPVKHSHLRRYTQTHNPFKHRHREAEGRGDLGKKAWTLLLLQFPKGIGVVSVLIVVATLSLISMFAASFVLHGQTSTRGALLRQRAFYIASAGLEYGLMQLSLGKNPDSVAKEFFGGNFKIHYDGLKGELISEAEAGVVKERLKASYGIKAPVMHGMAGCIDFKTDEFYFDENARAIKGIVINNSCKAPVIVKSVLVSWRPERSAERLVRIQIAGSDVYDDQKGQASGREVVLDNYKLSECNASEITFFRFNDQMNDKDLEIAFNFLDGGVSSAKISRAKSMGPSDRN